jgi:hypothetical protein
MMLLIDARFRASAVAVLYTRGHVTYPSRARSIGPSALTTSPPLWPCPRGLVVLAEGCVGDNSCTSVLALSYMRGLLDW